MVVNVYELDETKAPKNQGHIFNATQAVYFRHEMNDRKPNCYLSYCDTSNRKKQKEQRG